MILFEAIQADVILHPYSEDLDDMGVFRFDTAIGRGNTFQAKDHVQFTIGIENLFWIRIRAIDLLSAHTIRRFMDTSIDPKEFKSVVRSYGYSNPHDTNNITFIENKYVTGFVETRQKTIKLKKVTDYMRSAFYPLNMEVT